MQKRVTWTLSISVLITSISIALASPYNAEPIQPIPQPLQPLLPAKVQLGEQLFHDTRLSGNNQISCASCHELARGGHDGLPVSTGVGGAQGAANAPTVFNSSLNFAQFWDGRADKLIEQVNGPVHNPVEMNSSWPEVVAKLQQDTALQQQFRDVYTTGITAENIKDAIVAFENSLLTLDSRFDRWLNGDQNALTPAEHEGYRLFKGYGCISCHQGANVGGNMYAQLGAANDIRSYFRQRGTPLTPTDMGRFNVTGNEAEKYFFKVPSLRLAVKTAPYFHDGSVQKLEDAIKLMGRYQLNRELPEAHVQAIIRFLETLPGQHARLTE